MPRLGVLLPPATLERFWTMLAHYHGQIWNASGVRAVLRGVAHDGAEVPGSAFGRLRGRQLRPWRARTWCGGPLPEVYLRDSGILHSLLGLATPRDVHRHPVLGASWEEFALAQVRRILRARPEECFFWATHAGAELDLLIVSGRQRLGFEIKRTDTPAVTGSMRSAVETLRLSHLDVVHAGERTYPLTKGIRAVAAARLETDLTALRR